MAGPVEVRISEVAAPNDSLVVSGHDLSSMLFLLDGRRVAVAEVKALNEAEIESMSVLKDEWAVGRYGEAAADGVVYVTTTEGAGSSTVWSVVLSMETLSRKIPVFIGSRIRETDLRSVRSMEPDRLC